MKTIDTAHARCEMVEHQIAARGVSNQRVLDAMRKVPREEFLAPKLRELAYGDTPLPIAAFQTISQPYIVAFMMEALALEGGEKVLEIGTGSGYAAAVLAEIADEVFTVERIQKLADRATEKLDYLNYHNIHVLCGDGTLGWAEHAPYDGIVVAAGGPEVPGALMYQLKVGGRLVIPVGSTPQHQELQRISRVSEYRFKSEDVADVRFVPLIGAHGWKSDEAETVGASRKLPSRNSRTDLNPSTPEVDPRSQEDDGRDH